MVPIQIIRDKNPLRLPCEKPYDFQAEDGNMQKYGKGLKE